MKKTLLFLLGIISISVYAQSPGGVDGNELWYKTVPVTTDLQGTYHWADFSGDSVFLYQRRITGSDMTEFIQSRNKIHTINFHPALNLSDGVLGKYAYIESSNLAQATVIGVFAYQPATSSQDMVLYAINGRDGFGSIMSKDKVLRAREVTPLDYGSDTGDDLLYKSSEQISEEKFREMSPRIATYFKADNPNFNLWGEKQKTSILFGAAYSSSDPDFETSFDVTSFENEEFDGFTPEYIVYNRYLSPIERKKVESYLAVKYGITLNGSYFDSNGNLLWDRDENQAFHNRVAAFGYDMDGSLFQPLSSTSYEETPEFSSLKENDSYYLNNSYNLPSASHLLVMGREYGNALPDSGYVFWGDNDASISTSPLSDNPLWHIMDRSWLVRTNIPASADSVETRWSGSGFEVVRSGFLDNIIQTEAIEGAFVTTPTISEGGSVEFRCPVSHPSFEVGFTTDNNENIYGFRIHENGAVYIVNNGQVSSASITTDVNGRIISVRIENDKLYLRVDGIGNTKFVIEMPETAVAFNGIIRTISADSRLVLDSVRTGGIGDTGNQAELSYLLTAQKEFEDFCRNRTVLLIDPTGEGGFNPETNTVIRCSSPDISRGKIMFNNIFWDIDGSGSDIFTFAYYDGLAINAHPSPSTCIDGVPQKNGAIEIEVEFGTPTYAYTLSVDTVDGLEKDDIIASGTFVDETLRIDSLLSGSYIMSVSQGGGNYIYGTGNSDYDVYSHDSRTYQSGDVSWTISGQTSNYRIGLESTLMEERILYGFEVRDNRAYLIRDGRTSTSQYVTVNEGDTLNITVGNMQVVYRINGKAYYSETTWSLRSWRVCVKLGAGESHIINLSVNGSPLDSFVSSGSIKVETPKFHTERIIVHIGNECDNTLPNVTEEAKVNKKVKAGYENTFEGHIELTVYEISGSERTYHAVLKRDIDSSATLIVFDASGRMLSQTDMNGIRVKEASFTVPGSGVYIIKALTSDGNEFTRKIIVK